MGKERQLIKQEETRRLIIDTAREIISREGIEGLSVRKITNAMDYSPAIIYHYFKDKNEILETLVIEGYGRILSSIKEARTNNEKPEEEIKEVFTNYIKAALSFPEEYKAFMLNEDSSLLKRTGILQRRVSEERESLKLLCSNIQRGIDMGRYAPCDVELTAQILWTSTFGLIMRLMIEKDIGGEQVNRLIEEHFKVIFNGIIRNGVAI